MQPTTDRLLLHPAEAAHLLAISRSKLYSLCASKELPTIRVGKSIRVPLAALERWVEEQTAASTSLPPLSFSTFTATKATMRAIGKHTTASHRRTT